MPANYRYINQTTANGIELHILKTDASNIMFRNFKKEQSLVDSIFFGVNGGFFGNDAINIAKCDGVNYGGKHNSNVGGGIITWDGSSLHCYNNSSMRNVETVLSTNEKGTWAQGGYSMFLGASDARERSLAEVGDEDPDGYLTNPADGKTALVADMSTDTVYLIVARDENDDNTITFTDFRRAIQYYLNIPEGSTPSSRYKGLMLDGGGSTQLRGKKTNGSIVTVSTTGYKRPLCQVIVMRDAT